MFNKNVFIQLDENYIIKNMVNRWYLKTDKYNISSLENVKVNLKSKKAYILLEGEVINIKLLSLPRCSRKVLYDLVRNELFYYYEDINNISFSYTVLKENKHKVEVMVFYIDSKKIETIDKLIDNKTRINGAYLIQICFLNYFRKQISARDYIFIFTYNKNSYILYCKDNVIINNNTFISENYEMDVNDFLFSCIENNRIINGVDIKSIYFANGNYSLLIQDRLADYECFDLGYINNQMFLKSISVGR